MSQEKKNIRIQQKVDTKENWLSANAELLLEDEIGFEKETGQFKIGDGVHAWKDLSYAGIGRGTVQGGEIFNDYENNIAALYGSHVEGLNNTAKVLCYPGCKFEVDNGTNKPIGCINALDWTWDNEITSGMYVSTYYDGYKFRGIIDKIENGALYLDSTDGNTIDMIEYCTDSFDLIIDGGSFGTTEYFTETMPAHIEGARNTAYLNSHAEGVDNAAKGFGSHAEGRYNNAEGEYSHAEGYSTLAKGHTAHTEGVATQALGHNSHAEGSTTIAAAVNTHAEGLKTQALLDQSHAEGYMSIAAGGNSHAEGRETLAKGLNSHAEGYRNSANDPNKTKGAQGNFSHSEGSNTTSRGQSSHAEGNNTLASGENSHAEGYCTESTNYSSHSEGNLSKAFGKNSHAEGSATKASGENSHAEGNKTISKGVDSHAEGHTNEAWGAESHIEGYSGKTYDTAMVEVNMTIDPTDPNYGTDDHIIAVHKVKKFALAKGGRSHVEGQQNLALGDYTHAEGVQSIAKGENSHVEGWGTIASGKSQHVQGRYNVEDASMAHIVGWGSGASGSQRRNIHTLDTNGNAWFNGSGEFYGTLSVGLSNTEEEWFQVGLQRIIFNERITANSISGNILTLDSLSHYDWLEFDVEIELDVATILEESGNSISYLQMIRDQFLELEIMGSTDNIFYVLNPNIQWRSPEIPVIVRIIPLQLSY